MTRVDQSANRVFVAKNHFQMVCLSVCQSKVYEMWVCEVMYLTTTISFAIYFMFATGNGKRAFDVDSQRAAFKKHTGWSQRIKRMIKFTSTVSNIAKRSRKSQRQIIPGCIVSLKVSRKSIFLWLRTQECYIKSVSRFRIFLRQSFAQRSTRFLIR